MGFKRDIDALAAEGEVKVEADIYDSAERESEAGKCGEDSVFGFIPESD